jgi:peptidyl-tRNA hydrolase, PTH1 family
MHVIVGLGNPGRQYSHTRHNLGFMVVEAFAEQLTAANNWALSNAWQAHTLKGSHAGNSLVLIKPQTYMNLSGQAVKAVAQFYKVPVSQVLLVVDDVNLSFGRMRYRSKGSAGGHNGLKSVQTCLGTTEYARLRVGVGMQKHAGQALSDHVLAPFNAEERIALPVILAHTNHVLATWLTQPNILTQTDLANGWCLPSASAG